MQNLLQGLTNHFAGVPEAARQRKWLYWLFFIVLTGICFAGIERTRFDMTVEGWFDKDDPTIVAFDWFHQDFGSEDHLYIVYKAKDGNVFSDQSLAAAKGIRDDLLERMREANREGIDTPLNHIVKITSIVNAPVIRAEGNALVSEKLIPDPLPLSAQRRQEVIDIAYDQKQFKKMYFSEDHQYGGIFIETDFGAIAVDQQISESADQVAADFGLDLTMEDDLFNEQAVVTERPEFKPTDLEDYLALMEAVKETINDPKYADKFSYYPVGNTAMTEYDLAVMEEMGGLIFATFIIIAMLLWFLFRSLSAVVWPLLIVILSVVWSIGITGWLGLPVTSFIMITVLLTLAIGVADAVHIMSGYLSGRKLDMPYAEALNHAFKTKSVACLLTAVTTIVGMMALGFTDIVPVKTFGFMSALAVALAFIFTIYLLPLLLDIWAPNKTKAPNQNGSGVGKFIPNMARFSGQSLQGVLPFVERRPVTIVGLFMAFFALCIYGATLTKVDTNPIGQYPKDSPARENFAIVDSHMMGTQSMEIYLDMGRMNAFQDPFVLQAMDELQQHFINHYSDVVVRATSMVGVAKNAYKTLNRGNEDFYIIPDEPRLLSQTLFLFNNAAPEDRARLVSDNYDRAHITVRMLNAGSHEYINTFAAMRKDIQAMLDKLKTHYPEAKVEITGMLALMMQGADYLTHAQLQSFSLALVFISVILLVVFGSIRAGAIAIIPNLIPATMAFGLLGLFGMPLDFTAMMIAPVIIGIAVDDTVHFITRYRYEVSLDGDIKRALTTTISETGQAIVFTAVILGLGFGIMGLSGSEGTANIGRLGGLAILMGLLNDLLLLPAMILIFKLKFEKAKSVVQTAESGAS